MRKITMLKFSIVLLITIFLLSCGGQKIKPNISSAERMKIAKKLFDDGHYLDARTQFRIIVLNSPGGSLSDEAQYYYAECHFKLKEYILAIAEYEKLIRMYPNSEFVDDAQFKIGLSNYKLSPRSALDQTNTEKAIEEFQKFLEDFPGSPLVPKVNEYMKKCREKLARKNFDNGESYRKRALYRSALVYYDYVLDNYYDTRYAEKALWEKAECYRKLGNREQAKKFYQLYLEKYPKTSRAHKVKDLLSSLQTSEGSDN